MLTTEALVADIKEDDKKGAAQAAGLRGRAAWAECTKAWSKIGNTVTLTCAVFLIGRGVRCQ